MLKGGLRFSSNYCFSNKEPIITIVTVVYNCASEIQKTIDSVKSQTYKNIEYIVIDGNSTDGTVEIIKKNSSSIHLWQSEPDRGIYDAMNKAISLASGEWINFLNCGDIFASSDVVQKIFENDYDYDVIYGSVILHWNIGYELREPDTNKNNVMPFCHQSCFTRTSLLKQTKFDLKYNVCADRNFYKQINISNKITYKNVNFPVSIFDCIDSTSVNNDFKSIKEYMEIEEYNSIKKFIIMFKVYIKCCIKKISPSLMDKLRFVKMRKNLIDYGK